MSPARQRFARVSVRLLIALASTLASDAAAIAAPQIQSAVPSPALLVVNKAENSLAVIDPATAKPVKQIPTGEGPHEVAVSADGRTAYVTNYGSQAPGSSLSVIDLAAGRETRRVDLGALRRPHGLIVAGTAVYFTAESSRALARYDSVADAVDQIVGTGEAGTHMVVGTPEATLLFTSNIAGDSVSAMEWPAGGQAWIVTRIPVGKGPEGIDLSPNGKELWTAHSRDGGLSIVDAATKQVTATMDLRTKRSNRLRFTPDGRHVLVSDLDVGDLIVIDAATRTISKRVPLGKAPSGILVVPDGSRAYVALTGENALAVVDLKTFEVIGRVSTGAGPDGMAWIASRASRESAGDLEQSPRTAADALRQMEASRSADALRDPRAILSSYTRLPTPSSLEASRAEIARIERRMADTQIQIDSGKASQAALLELQAQYATEKLRYDQLLASREPATTGVTGRPAEAGDTLASVEREIALAKTRLRALEQRVMAGTLQSDDPDLVQLRRDLAALQQKADTLRK